MLIATDHNIIVKGSGDRYEARVYVGNGSIAFYGTTAEKALAALQGQVDTDGADIRFQTADLLSPDSKSRTTVPYEELVENKTYKIAPNGIITDIDGVKDGAFAMGLAVFGIICMIAWAVGFLGSAL